MANIKMVHFTDGKSLYNLLQRRGAIHGERRLLVDIEALRTDIEELNLLWKWVYTRQMWADRLTKSIVEGRLLQAHRRPEG